MDEWGDSVWTGVYAGDSNEAAFDMQIMPDRSYIIVGSTNSYGAGAEDVYLIKTEPDTLGVREHLSTFTHTDVIGPTFFTGPIILPEGKECKIFDITGRVVIPDKIRPGIYFVEIDKKIVRKVIKVK
ncbi:MAG: T9SS type A sorting domain-containing protein [bacterium]